MEPFSLLVAVVFGGVVGFVIGARSGYNRGVDDTKTAGAAKKDTNVTAATKLPVKSETDTKKKVVVAKAVAKAAPKKRGRPAKKVVAPTTGKTVKKGPKNR